MLEILLFFFPQKGMLIVGSPPLRFLLKKLRIGILELESHLNQY